MKQLLIIYVIAANVLVTIQSSAAERNTPCSLDAALSAQAKIVVGESASELIALGKSLDVPVLVAAASPDRYVDEDQLSNKNLRLTRIVLIFKKKFSLFSSENQVAAELGPDRRVESVACFRGDTYP